jgi:hypothetical protein
MYENEKCITSLKKKITKSRHKILQKHAGQFLCVRRTGGFRWGVRSNDFISAGFTVRLYRVQLRGLRALGAQKWRKRAQFFGINEEIAH